MYAKWQVHGRRSECVRELRKRGWAPRISSAERLMAAGTGGALILPRGSKKWAQEDSQ